MNKNPRIENSEDHRFVGQQGIKNILNLRPTRDSIDSGLTAQIVLAIDPKHMH